MGDDVVVSSKDQKEMHAEDMRRAALEAALKKFFELSGNKPFPSHVLQTAREYENFIFGR